jgi:hypothetical protein
MVHILQLIVEPHEKRYSTFRDYRFNIRCRYLNVQRLEEITMEELSEWLNIETIENARQKILLKDIFWVAKMEEKYKNGEIGKNITSKARRQTDCVLQTNIHASMIRISKRKFPKLLGSTQGQIPLMKMTMEFSPAIRLYARLFELLIASLPSAKVYYELLYRGSRGG